MRALSALAWATAFFTFVLLTVGGSVHATGSSLACPDWPLCHGELMPEMTGGVEFEHTHRLLGTLVGLLTIAVTVLCWRGGKRDPLLRRLGVAALVIVVVQGVMGGVTVLLRLSLPVSMAHLATSMLFLGLLGLIAWRAGSREWSTGAPEDLAAHRRGVLWVLALVYAQILLGGLVRHTTSGSVCGDDPILCAGFLWPPYWRGQLQMVHRVVAVIVLLVAMRVMIKLALAAVDKGHTTIRAMAWGAIGLLVAQITLGVVTVMTLLEVVSVTAHLSVAALLLMDLAGTYVLLRPPVTVGECVPERRALADGSSAP